MVAHRFLEALASRDLLDHNEVVVLGGESRPAYDRVQLSSAFAGATLDALTLDATSYAGHRRGRLARHPPPAKPPPTAEEIPPPSRPGGSPHGPRPPPPPPPPGAPRRWTGPA